MPEMFQTAVTIIGSILGGGVINSVTTYLLAKRKDTRAAQLEEDTQVFNRSMAYSTKLEARVEILEKGLANSNHEHLECEKRHAFLEGRFEEIMRIAQQNSAKLAELTQSHDPTKSGILGKPSDIVAVAVLPGKHDPSVLAE